ncbi:unnamed protein product [Aureobasidium uvarum]|uniref:Uncharacterized protein n=1 Tax=Aureobasidium uvarum TaxID=2773716 RepID=A0A9N8KQN4_9PEZI|nr:unnamed protein product [Aureobasidium uvarum]
MTLLAESLYIMKHPTWRDSILLRAELVHLHAPIRGFMLTRDRSYCDTRYKIAGQWYGIPKVMAKSQTLKTEVVDSQPDRIIFKLQQEYTPRVVHFSKPVNSLVTLTLDDQGKVKYHKDMWNEKDYSHEGLGKIMKTLNGDHLTKVSVCQKEKRNAD